VEKKEEAAGSDSETVTKTIW